MWLRNNLPTEIPKAVMLLPSVKSSMKYHFLEEIDQQCRDLCVWKHLRPFCMSAEKKTKSRASLGVVSRGSSVLQEIKERAPDLLDFIARLEKHLPKGARHLSVS